MGSLLAIGCALAFGACDFGAGVASRRFSAGPVTAVVEAIGLCTAILATLFFAGGRPDRAILIWGTVGGVGGGVGTLALYRGLAVGRMSLVATVAAVLTAVIPVIAGVALGHRPGPLVWIGLVGAVVAITLVSWQPDPNAQSAPRSGLLYGVVSGAAFSFLYIGLHQAGTHAGAWPLIPGTAAAVLVVAPFAVIGLRFAGRPSATAVWYMLAAGLLGGVGNLLFLASTNGGELAIVAVLSSMGPGVTVVLARIFLAERWTKLQAGGLLLALGAMALLSVG